MPMDPLKFIVLDEEDLEVVSAHVQDAVVKAADMLWRPQEKRVVVGLNRFDWEGAQNGASRNTAAGAPPCVSSACSPASAAISIRPARTPCSTCWRSNSPRPTRRPAW